MATKMRKVGPSYRKLAKPVISTDIMGNRNVEVRAVGAWVQAEPAFDEPDGVIAAEQEEERLHHIQLQKQARLRHFQQEVKKRVNHLDKLKKKALLETNVKATEQERNVVGQSAFSSQDFAKKDNCIIRPKSALAVDKSAASKPAGKPETEETHTFSDQTNQVHRYVNNARKNLVSRRMISDNYVGDDLPGGVWKISKTRDERELHPSSRYTVDGVEFDLLDDHLIDKVKVINNKVYDTDGDKENFDVENTDYDIPQPVEYDSKPEEQVDKRKERIERRPKSATTFRGTNAVQNVQSVRVPNIYEGVQSEDEKRRVRSQQATYRRLFMDLEREQVKENLRRQEHRKRITRLKKEKEEERVREEQMSQQLIEPRDPVTGETSLEAVEREEQERRFIRQTIREHERRVKKAREMERYIEALRQQLKDKTRRRKVELPPLCCCGETVWDTNPETCANNCIFYKNPKEYGRALQTLLDSSELLS